MLIQADAAGLEWRTLLELSRDSVGIGEVLGGEDTHGKNQEYFKLPSRLIAKIYLFRTIYRGSGWSFAHDPDFSGVSKDPRFWDKLNEQFYEKYNGIDKCHKYWATRVTRSAKIIGPSGREWFIPMGTDSRGGPKIPWTDLTNWPVQGTGADIVAVARISLRNRLKSSGLYQKGVYLCNSVHDSLVVDSPRSCVDESCEMMHNVFRDIPANFKKLYNYDMVLPFPCETKIGMNLLEMTKYGN